MQIDKNMIDKLLKTDDATMKAKLKEAMDSAGIVNDKLNNTLSDVSNIKKILSEISENDLKKVATVIGTNKIEDVLQNLKKNM